MTSLYRSEAARLDIASGYRAILDSWPVARTEHRIPTREGETFVVECGPAEAPPLFLFHGSVGNAAMWMGHVARLAADYRCFAVDMIGEPGLSAPSRPPLDGEAHALWLDDVFAGLCVERAALAGMSLGGWLALDHAIRRPERVAALALVVPAGIGRQKNLLAKAFPLLFLGAWGKRKLREMVFGPQPADPPPEAQAFHDFMTRVMNGFRARIVRIPIASDEELAALAMPVLAILAGRDVLVDGPETRDRMARLVPDAEIDFRPDARHYIPDTTPTIADFLHRTYPA